MIASTNSLNDNMTPNPRPLLARLNWYWIFQLGGWVAVAVFNLVLYSMVVERHGVVAVCWWCSFSGLLLSHLWHGQIKRRGWASPTPRWRRLLAGLLVVGAAQALSVAAAIVVLQGQTITGLAWLPVSMMFWGGILGAWTVCYLSALALRRANRFEAEALRLEVQAKDTELRALQAQVNPHFFFNSMNSVRALIYQDQHAAAQMIDQLASMMRYALQSGQADTVPLADELEAVQAYLAIEKIRFEERMRVSLELEAGLARVRIPPMALQTLVENAVKYGVESNPDGSEIRIRVGRRDGMVDIEIGNAGAILPFANSTKVGLVNTRKRLALVLGGAARLDLSEHAGWVRATLTLPEAA